MANYTTQETVELVEAYQAAESDEEREEVIDYFKQKLGKSKRSIIAKLSNEQIYQARRYRTKTGEIPVKKEVLVAKIATHLEVNEEIIESLENANKHTIKLLLAKLEECKNLSSNS